MVAVIIIIIIMVIILFHCEHYCCYQHLVSEAELRASEGGAVVLGVV